MTRKKDNTGKDGLPMAPEDISGDVLTDDVTPTTNPITMGEETLPSDVATIVQATLPETDLSSTTENPRVGWIYDLRKDDLVAEMTKYGLDLTGTSATLRHRFAEFWRKPRGAIHRSSSMRLTTSSAPDGTDQAWKDVGNLMANIKNELASVREILGLSPNADSAAVRRTLSSLMRPTHTLPGAGKEDSGMLSHTEHDRGGDPSRGLGWTTGHSEPAASLPSHGERTWERPTVNGFSLSTLCNTVRKWNLRFDGRQSPVSFMERLEELMEAYEIPGTDLMKALPEILDKHALLWYRNTKADWRSFSDFRRSFELQFFPAGYRRQLDEEIRKRTQGEHELFRDFLVAITTLIRRSGAISHQNKLDLIYSNMRPEYKVMIRRADFTCVDELVLRAEDYEAYVRDKANFRPPPAPAASLVPETAYYGRPKNHRIFESATIVNESTTHEVRADDGTTGRKQVLTDSRPSTAEGGQKTSKSKRAMARTQTPPAGTKEVSHVRTNLAPTQARTYKCFNCGETGHFARDCKPARSPRCSKVEDARAPRPSCNSENYRGTRQYGGQLSPEEE